MKAKENLYRSIAVALGSINYGVCSDSDALNDLANLLEDMLDQIDAGNLIVIDHADYVDCTKEDDEHETV